MNNIDMHLALLSALWGACLCGLAWYVMNRAQQITYVTLADGRKQERRIPILFRLLLPLAPNFAPLYRKSAFATSREKLDTKLVSAGFDGMITSEEFLALKLILPLCIGIPWELLAWLLVNSGGPLIAKFRLLFYFVIPLWLYIYPDMWLRGELNRRHTSIRKALPFVLDLLTLSVEAGMDFMTGIQRCIERRGVDALGEELIRVIRNNQLGKTRREALREMSKRVSLPELRSVVNALVQADELGVSIGAILRIQAAQIRMRRFERAEKLANEAPVKMLFPLMFFIFPAVFLILLGPVVGKLMQQGF